MANNHNAEIDDEYEYEYDEHETETFYVDLDLSSLNGLMKPKHQPKKKLISAKSARAKSTFTVEGPAGTNSTPTPGPTNGEAANTPTTPAVEETQQAAMTPADSTISVPEAKNDIQILELHSHNPVISYRNEVYSCTWSDLIGTNLFFAKHDEDCDPTPLRSKEEYDLLGTSRIKLIGRKAKMTNKLGKKGGQKRAFKAGDDIADVLQDDGVDLTSGRSLGNLHFNNATVNRDVKKQARFLQRLMEVKRAKGETDNVRTVFKPRNSVQAKSRGPAKDSNPEPGSQSKEAVSQEIADLNRRVVRGDADALARLQQIYSYQGEEPAEGSPDLPQMAEPT